LKYTEAGFAIHNEPAEKGRKKKKTHGLTLGSPPEKGGKKKTLVFTHLSVEVLKLRIGTSTDGRTDAQTTQLI
jgi:hypothetical protein